MCEYCSSYGDTILVSPKSIEFVDDCWFLVRYSNLNDDDDFIEYVKKILLKYADGILDYEKLERFTNESYSKTIEVVNICNSCKKKASSIRVCFTYAIYRAYYDLIYQLFMEAFKQKYKANGSFLIENKVDTNYIASLIFGKDDNDTIRIFKLSEIRNIIPNEKGGPGEELLKEAVKVIAFGLLSNFLYEILKSKIRIAREIVRNKASEYKQKIDNKKIVNDLREYMKSENVEWNEDVATSLIDQRLNNLIEEYICSIYEDS